MVVSGHGGKIGDYQKRVDFGDPLTNEDVRELFEILRAIREKSDQQNKQIADLERSLEQARRDRWLDWAAGAVVGLALTILAKLFGLPV